MLEMNAHLIRKPDPFKSEPCRIVAVEAADPGTFLQILNNPLRNRSLIARHADELGYDEEAKTTRCLLILNRHSEDGLLVDSAGFDYCRYAAYASAIRPAVEQSVRIALEQMLSAAIDEAKFCAVELSTFELTRQCGFALTEENGLLGVAFDYLGDSADVWGWEEQSGKITVEINPALIPYTAQVPNSPTL